MQRLGLEDGRALAGLFTSTSRILAKHQFDRDDVLVYERVRGDAAGEHHYRLADATKAALSQITKEAASE